MDRSVIIEAIFVLLGQLDALIADARGREPAPMRTTVLEDTADYDPEKPRFLQLRRMGEEGGETVAYARWRRRGELWARSWRLALVTLVRLIDDPSDALAYAELAKRRRLEARAALDAYPTLFVVEDAALTSAASFDAFARCEDDEEARTRLDKVVDDVLSAQFKTPGAKDLLDRALAIKAADGPPVDFYSHKNPRSRAIVHGASGAVGLADLAEMLRHVGGLSSESRDDGGDDPEAVRARRRIDAGERGVWLLKTIVVQRGEMAPRPPRPPFAEAPIVPQPPKTALPWRGNKSMHARDRSIGAAASPPAV